MDNKQDQDKPVVLGEDFDVFPKLNENDLKGSGSVTYKSEAEAKPEPEKEAAPAETTDLQKKIAEIDEEKWKTYLRIGGVLTGLVSSACLYLLPLLIEGSSTYGLIIAVVIAFLGPGYAEKQFGRSINTGRKWMLITFGVSLALFVAYILLVKDVSPAA